MILLREIDQTIWPTPTTLYVVRRTALIGTLRKSEDGWRWGPNTFGRRPSRKVHALALPACRHSTSLSDEVLTAAEWEERRRAAA